MVTDLVDSAGLVVKVGFAGLAAYVGSAVSADPVLRYMLPVVSTPVYL